jgi:hypothetical protein
MLERSGEKWMPRKPDENGNRHFIGAVAYTSDFRRIEQLPRRDWTIEPMATEIKKLMTKELKMPGGAMELWTVQAIALAEIAELHGAFCPVGVGMGKSLVSLLAPVVLDAKRPLLLVPAALRDQTLSHVVPKMRKHWRLSSALQVRGYSEISLEKNKDLLDELSPDLIIFDECHYLKNKSAGRTKRVLRFLREHPDVWCAALSGTIASRSLKDWSHISQWTLRDGSPVPSKWQELSEWAEALDADVPEEQRFLPGALKKFCKKDESPRAGFRRRLVETPGVIATKENDLGCSLVIQARNPAVPLVVQAALEKLRTSWETPNGDPLTNAIDLWRHAREIALGFWYAWTEAPPQDWMKARRVWKRYVRETLKHNRRGLDTELQVWNESSRGPHIEWSNWSVLKDSFKPISKPRWISDFAIQDCVKWFEEDAGIVWVEHVAFGERLSQFTNFRYFGAGDNDIVTTPETKIIASIQAHCEGKNLQRWFRNLIVSPPARGQTWEQVLGRTHREGQQADEVSCDVFLHAQELRDGFEHARSDARYLEETYGHRQKLNFADMVMQ